MPRKPKYARACRGQRSGQEDGFILVAVLFLVALILIGMAVAAPQIARSIQRDKDMELVHRGEQYKRAIKLYYRKFGSYPTSIDQLVETNNIRFLRKRYKDPITGKDDWRLIHLGQAKVPPMGLFGQPLTGLPGMPVAATGPAATPNTGSSTASPFGSVTVDTPDNSDTSTDSGNDSGSVENADTHPSVTITGAAPAPTPSAGGANAGTTTGTQGASTSAFAGSAGTGGAFGGGPIVGVGIPITKPSLIVYKKQKRYNQWEFVYNPFEDQMQAAGVAGAGGTGTTPGTTPATTTGNSPGFGSSPPNTGMGNSGPTGSNDTQPPGASAQQQ